MPKNPTWVENLQDKDSISAKRLNSLLLEIARHKGVYSLSGDPAVAQLWFAVLEISRKQDDFRKELDEIKQGRVQKASEMLKKRTEKRSEILEALENY